MKPEIAASEMLYLNISIYEATTRTAIPAGACNDGKLNMKYQELLEMLILPASLSCLEQRPIYTC